MEFNEKLAIISKYKQKISEILDEWSESRFPQVRLYKNPSKERVRIEISEYTPYGSDDDNYLYDIELIFDFKENYYKYYEDVEYDIAWNSEGETIDRDGWDKKEEFNNLSDFLNYLSDVTDVMKQHIVTPIKELYDLC